MHIYIFPQRVQRITPEVAHVLCHICTACVSKLCVGCKGLSHVHAWWLSKVEYAGILLCVSGTLSCQLIYHVNAIVYFHGGDRLSNGRVCALYGGVSCVASVK